ncbi:hypothetical protein A2704_06785 [Candidatus Kaiserbacteria bacterium RIFCSPHIGHO2_01_FULL_54_36b]|uniref:Uncharacterized protein n=1 Tax=Candidatus Kaiserbacteria bacterium RIFCSPHIGHO2_01_FULL_54_36b TaxID=1798483 RepID=A0A1F6CRW7_9BACT|nr:MAG: hypothetical protein A2704_06785 [Candidatus Kaiserbacteria bacterium RIFCSPHIGHO2_01_FULL_54_36b]
MRAGFGLGVYGNFSADTERNFAFGQSRAAKRRGRGGRKKYASLRDEFRRGGGGEAGGFVTNGMVRSDFLDEGGNFG